MPANNHFPANDYFFPAAGDTSRMLAGCRREDYSASRIASAVEDCDAHLLNLNIVSMGQTAAADTLEAEYDNGPFQVIFDIRVSHRNPASIQRSLERYGYTVIDIMADEESEDDVTRRRIDEFIRYLEI